MTAFVDFFRRLPPSTIRVLILLGVVLALIAIRVVVGARNESNAADAFFARKDYESAIVHYRRAARWYTPFNPYVSHALAQLRGLGETFDRRGDLERALTTYRAVRAAIQSSRSFYTPHRDELLDADRHIASLMARLPPPPIDAQKSPSQREQEYLAQLRKPARPYTAFSFMALLGFFVWITSAYRFFTRAIDERDRFIRREAVRVALVGVAGFALFVCGLRFA